ncbi:MAG TPA: YheV family putative zinc ribbon protein [Marinagarivorans sp.]
MVSGKKRFIAGAICPKCKAMDRIVMYRQGDKDFRECVECGFEDEIRFQNPARELETRVNVSEAQIRTETQAVKLVTPGDNNQ